MSTADPQPAPSANRQIARAAGIVMMAFVFSNLIGLARNMVVIRVFGAGLELDSFYAANRVAEMLFNLVAGGALGSAFIPTFTGLLTKPDRPAAWRLASAVANLILLVLIAVSILAAVFAPQIVHNGLFLFDPVQNPFQADLTIRLLRVLLPSVAIFGLSGLVMGILNAHQIFLIPSLAPGMYSFGWILGVLLLPASWGVERLAWGAVLGALLHLLIQLPQLIRLRGRYQPTLGLAMPEVREVARLMGPRLFGVAVVQLNFIVNTMIALGLPEGSVSAVGQGFALMLMPQVAIAQSIAIAAMPTFSAQVARGAKSELRASLAATLRGVILLAIPAMIGLIALRAPLVSLLYGSGECGPTCTGMIAWALLWYAVGLLGHSLVELVSRAFYALHDTRTPVLLVMASMTLNILFSLLFTRVFARLGWQPLGGLGLANSLATFLEMLALLTIMRRRLGGLDTASLLRGGVTALLAAGVMLLALLGWLALPGLPGWARVLGGVGLGGLVYALTLLALRIPETRLVMGLAARLKSRLLP